MKSEGAVKMPEQKSRYSRSEQLLFNLLMRQRKAPTDARVLATLFYEGREEPFHSMSTLNSILRDLERKMVINGEPWAIRRSERRGPHPMKYHLVKK